MICSYEPIDVKEIAAGRRRSNWWAAVAIALYGFLLTSLWGSYVLFAWLL